MVVVKLLHTLIIVTLVSSFSLAGCSSNQNAAAPVEKTNVQEPTFSKSQNGSVTNNENRVMDNTSQTNPEAKKDEPAATSKDATSNAVPNKAESAATKKEEVAPVNKTEGISDAKPNTSPQDSSGNKGGDSPIQTKGSDTENAVSSSTKSGTTKMLSETQNLKSEIDNADDTKIISTASQLVKLWTSFEDNVKSQYPDLYAKVEKYLFPLVASTQQSPIDKKILAKLNGLLSQALNELLTKVN